MTAVEATSEPVVDAPDHGISFREAAAVWAKVAMLSFGGPAGQIAVMHRILVEEKKWIGESRFLHALSYCMLLPGPEAQQLAVYIGWLLHKTKGGLVAGTLFVLPGFIAIMILSWIYAALGNVGLVQALFFSLKAAVLAIVVEAVARIGRRALKNAVLVALAAAAFVVIFLNVPGPGRMLACRRGTLRWGSLCMNAVIVAAYAFPTRTCSCALFRVNSYRSSKRPSSACV